MKKGNLTAAVEEAVREWIATGHGKRK